MTRKEKYEAARIAREEAMAHYNAINPFVTPTKGVDSGAFGKAREIAHTRDNSLKKGVSKQGRADNYFNYNGNGRTPYEYKTNGGRVGGILRSLENGHDGFVVYELHICNANTSKKPRDVAPVIMHYSTFINFLEEVGALHENSRDGEMCIQSSKKDLYLRLLDYPIVFDETQKYTADDFEGIAP